MYLSTTLAALLAAVTMTASATPVLDARQETPRIYARFFGGGGCQEPWLEDTVFLQTVPVGECQDVTVGPFGSTNFAQNLLTRTCESCLSLLFGWSGQEGA